MGKIWGPWYKVHTLLSEPSSPEFHWAAPRISQFDPPPPLLPVKRLGRVWSWSGRSAHRPGLLPHKDTLLVSEKKLPFCFPVAFLTRPTTFLTDLSAWRGRSQIPPSLGTVAEDKQRSS